MNRWAILVALLGSACADEETAAEPVPADDADEQLARALLGDLDPEAKELDALIRLRLDERSVAELGELEWDEADSSALLGNPPFMSAWAIVGHELGGIRPLHLIPHPGCTFVGNVVGGWAHAVAATLRDRLGSSRSGAHAPAVSLYFAKKAAQTFDVTVDEGYQYASHCEE